MADHLAVLMAALIAAVFFVRHLKAIVIGFAFVVLVLVFAGIIELMPVIAQLIQGIQSARRS